jgi:hypothetical protein
MLIGDALACAIDAAKHKTMVLIIISISAPASSSLPNSTPACPEAEFSLLMPLRFQA